MIIPAILETSFEEIQKKFSSVKDEVSTVQIDVADGVLVYNTSFAEVPKVSELGREAVIELHLMVQNPLEIVQQLPENVKRVIVHVESQNFEQACAVCRHKGLDTGLCLNPATSIHDIEPFLKLVDYVQFMTVEPGAQGNPFKSEVIEKISKFKSYQPYMPVQVDGGINDITIQLFKGLSIENFAIGSAIFKNSDPVKEILRLSSIAENLDSQNQVNSKEQENTTEGIN